MTEIDQRIDELYQLPPSEFTVARTALAKRLTGEQARRVKALKKPSNTPWAVNQLYWKARSLYDRVIQRGQAVRTAEIAALKGRQADVPHAAEVHRKAIRDAVHRATDLASAARVNASAEELARMFEALSLMSSTPAEPHGRLTTVVEPATGFAALAGVTPAKRVAEAPPKDRATTTGKKVTLSVVPHAVERRVRKASQERRASEAAVEAAIRTLDRARVREQAARRSLEHAETDVQVAEHEVVKARQRLSGERRALEPRRARRLSIGRWN